MRRLVTTVALAFAMTVPSAFAGSSKISTMFRDPDATPQPGAKKAVAVLSRDADLRRRAEGGLARRIKNAMAASTILSDDDFGSRESIKRRLSENAIDIAVVITPVAEETRAEVLTSSQTVIAYPTFYDYWDVGWTTMTLPGAMNFERVVTVEITIYSVAQEKLIWAGRMKSENPKSLRVFLDELVEVGAEELARQKLV
jgi:hypothetical protein